jgi:hypothetical protein
MTSGNKAASETAVARQAVNTVAMQQGNQPFSLVWLRVYKRTARHKKTVMIRSVYELVSDETVSE